MPAPITAGLAPDLVLVGGYILRVTALNPTTGATVAGVTISNIALQVDAAESEPDDSPVQLAPPVASFGGAR